MKTTANSKARPLQEVVQPTRFFKGKTPKNSSMRLKTILMLHKMSVPQLVAFAQHIVTRMTGNGFFVIPLLNKY